jgi:hypothetical protein
VAHHAVLAPDAREARHLAVQETRGRGRADFQRHRLAQQRRARDRRAGAQQLDLELEQLRQRLAAVHRAKEQLVFAERRVGTDYSCHGVSFLSAWTALISCCASG